MWFGAVTFGAFALFGLALPWLSPDDPRVHGLAPLGYGLAFASAAAVSIFYARYLPRYGFTIAVDGFREAPRHPVEPSIPWSRVARLEPRTYRRRLQLRGARGELLGSLEYDVAEVLLDERYSQKLDVAVRLTNGRVQYVVPTDGDVTGVLLAARAAHAAGRAVEAQRLNPRDPPPHAVAARTP